FSLDMISPGWNAPETQAWLQESFDSASLSAFGKASAATGGGGGVPFLAMLGEKIPDAQFLVTGVLGPMSNAHGPNEFLHLPTAKRITVALACLLNRIGRDAQSRGLDELNPSNQSHEESEA